MKKYYFLLFAAICMATTSKAIPGDTTWVQANICSLTYYNNYDTTINFPTPGTSYRKIYMIFTLGKYMCPGYNPANAGSGSVPWCGDWDYTVLNYLMTPSGDTLELGRLITPYANALAPRTPWAATQVYTYDVTDYAYLLHDSASMRILFSGYSGGFTANIRFAFIEGTPDRDVIAIHRLWRGSYAYGDTAHSDSFDINTHFTARTETVPTGAVTSDLKFIVTGHGSDPNGCCEFMSHNYQVMLNGSSVGTQTIWRDNCGSNWLYPQSGTWLYNRANWCPGDMVYPKYNVLPGLVPGSNFNVSLLFDSYLSNGAGSYTTEASLIYYGAINKVLDASIDDIIAPTTNQLYFRENPLGGKPTLLVKNTGASVIDSITFKYGVQDSVPQYYTWVGTLNPLHDTEVVLPVITALGNIAATSGTYTFLAQIIKVNGSVDDDATNNTMTSPFVSAPVWPSPFKIRFKTNNDWYNDPAICASNWIIYDMNNNIVREHVHANLSTLYSDTVNLPVGCYKLQVNDSECDGLNWWNFANYSPPITSGYIQAVKFPNTILPLNQNGMTGTYNNDFGCGFVQYFYIDSSSMPLSISNISGNGVSIEAYTNPARGVVNIDISGISNVQGKIEIIDMLGRVVSVTLVNNPRQQINVEQLVSGVYTVLFINDINGNKLQTKLLIAK